MVTKLKTIEKITAFSCYKNDIFYVNTGNILYSVLKSKAVELDRNCSSIINYDDGILLLDDRNLLILSYPRQIVFNEQISKSHNDLIYFYRNKIPNRIYGIYLNGINIFESNQIFGDFSLFENFIIENRNIYINKVTLTNQIIWTFSLFDLGKVACEDKPDEVENILGLAYENIWIRTKGGRLIALDKGTGKINHKFSGRNADVELGYTIVESIGKTFFDQVNQKILCISSSHFHSIDLNTRIIDSVYNYYEEDPLGIGKYERIYSPLLQGGYFTFIAQKNDDYGGIRFIGIFDYRKKKLVWEYEVISPEEKKAGNHLVRPQPLYMSGDKLYIKDFKNTLHIFQREV